MIVEFHDQPGQMRHADFQEWRQRNPGGWFLKFKNKATARLHASECDHSGSTDWTPEEYGKSLTASRKVCAEDQVELLAWAERAGLAIVRCQHCVDRIE